ncbi:MAG: lytic transglycosylase F, partial [Gammaproteobacteria bacterium]
AWAVRKNNPELLESLNAFLRQHRKGTLLGNIFFKRYFQDTKWVGNPLAQKERERLHKLLEIFARYSDEHGFDWTAIAAQGYQESRLDQNVRSAAGAIGIMQLLPSTAADPNVGIPDITTIENNIKAGVKYMAFLRDRYFSDPAIPPEDQVYFAFAAYNAGPARVRQLRDKASAMGLDPNRWFNNVERAAMVVIGRETVRYVANIYKYYIAYRLVSDQIMERDKERAEARGDEE